MSCIVGIINIDGSPVDPDLLNRMTGTMARRAPDASEIWCTGNVGLGHAMLRISPESDKERQPCTLDNQVWITADARIDGQAELIRKLCAAGQQLSVGVPDVEIILHAYFAFGESFLDHLIGDFSFALWDQRQKKLICVRDQFGVRPFFYVRLPSVFLFASSINSLLEHPLVSRQLDEEAIGDFLLFGDYQNPEITIYKNIRRLPSSFKINLVDKEFKLKKYWKLPQNYVVRYRKDSDYGEKFREIFDQAVNDRLRANHVAVQLSGGMDCTSVAASGKISGCSLAAYTNICTDLLPDDQEGYYAGLVASYLGIPVEYRNLGDYGLFGRSFNPEMKTSEPCSSSSLAAYYDSHASIAKSGVRILLTGQGGDSIFDPSTEYYAQIFRAGNVKKLIAETWRHVGGTGSLAGLGLRTLLLGARKSNLSWRPRFPNWVNTDFAQRTQLKDRWELAWSRMSGTNGSYEQLSAPWVSSLFEAYETPELPVVARHPFFDLRLAIFVMGLPTYMKVGKKTLREAMRGRLPELVRTRPKTPSVGDYVRVLFVGGRIEISKEFRINHIEKDYINSRCYWSDFEKYLAGDGMESTWSSCHMVNPIALNSWLSQQ